MTNTKIGFIGCGMMGGALIRAIAKSVPPKNIVLFDTDPGKTESLADEVGAKTASSADSVATEVDYLFIAVKPGFVAEVLQDITTVVPQEKLPVFVSIAAGFKIEKLHKAALTEASFIRLMPNIPAAVGEGMIALTCDSDIDVKHVDMVKNVLSKAGKVEQVPEYLMDCVTGISGSGPAYGFVFIEALADAAVKLGMPRGQAYIYAAQTLKGAAAMVLENNEHPAMLKDAVCSPGGTTIDAVAVLEKTGFRNSVIEAACAAAKKSADLFNK